MNGSRVVDTDDGLAHDAGETITVRSYASCMQQGQTSIRVAPETRDALAAIAEELGGVSLDEALRTVLWQRAAVLDIQRLHKEQAELDEYQQESETLAEVDTAVDE